MSNDIPDIIPLLNMQSSLIFAFYMFITCLYLFCFSCCSLTGANAQDFMFVPISFTHHLSHLYVYYFPLVTHVTQVLLLIDVILFAKLYYVTHLRSFVMYLVSLYILVFKCFCNFVFLLVGLSTKQVSAAAVNSFFLIPPWAVV